MNTVVELFPENSERVSDAELNGMRIGAQLNASLKDGPEKRMWESIAAVMVELEERRRAEKWGDSRG
jgi:hypothetical protein